MEYGASWVLFVGVTPEIWIFWFLLKAETRFHGRYIKFPEPLWHTQVLLGFLHAAPR
jgi:hypothetical protein